MNLSDRLFDYLFTTSKVLDAGIIITNLSHIVYANAEFSKNRYNPIDEKLFINNKISDDLHGIITEWSKITNFDNNLFKMYNKDKNMDTLKLIDNDDTSYYAQLVFPLFHNNKLDGLFICFRTHKNYINSSVKPARTTRNLTEKMIDDNYLIGVN